MCSYLAPILSTTAFSQIFMVTGKCIPVTKMSRTDKGFEEEVCVCVCVCVWLQMHMRSMYAYRAQAVVSMGHADKGFEEGVCAATLAQHVCKPICGQCPINTPIFISFTHNTLTHCFVRTYTHHGCTSCMGFLCTAQHALLALRGM